MANITIQVPDAALPRIVNAFTTQYGYQDTLADGTPNPQTKQQFVTDTLRSYLRATVVAVEANTDKVQADERTRVETSLGF